MTNVGGSLTRLVACYNSLGLNETESVNDDFAFDGLNGVDDNGDGAGVKGLEGL